MNLTKSTKHAGRKLPFAAKPKLVRVEWVDAHSDDSWQHEEDVNYKPRPITTSGYLIWKDKETMVIAGSIDAEPPGLRIISRAIPNGTPCTARRSQLT